MSSSSLTTAQRDILSSDFNELMSQAGNFILDASFNNMNLLTNSADNVTTLSNLSGGSLTGTASASLAAITDEFTNLKTAVDSALAVLGADVRSLELQTDFLSDISDATEEGLSDIVDADLARESARLLALQVQQQLAVQTLGIVNSAPQALLALFR